MTAGRYREGQPCPAACGQPLVWCEGDGQLAEVDQECTVAGPGSPPDTGHGRHLICLGCGQDAGECDVADCVEWDLGTCPYYARSARLPGHDPEGICSFGCQEEPACITSEPSDGWPSQRRHSTLVGWTALLVDGSTRTCLVSADEQDPSGYYRAAALFKRRRLGPLAMGPGAGRRFGAAVLAGLHERAAQIAANLAAEDAADEEWRRWQAERMLSLEHRPAEGRYHPHCLLGRPVIYHRHVDDEELHRHLRLIADGAGYRTGAPGEATPIQDR